MSESESKYSEGVTRQLIFSLGVVSILEWGKYNEFYTIIMNKIKSSIDRLYRITNKFHLHCWGNMDDWQFY